MSQYRNGQFVSAGTAVTIPLGFIPDRFRIINYTNIAEGTEVFESEWINGVTPNGKAILYTTAGAPVISIDSGTAGISGVSIGGDWQNTIYTITAITKANPGVVNVASAQPTNSLALVNGMTFTISSVVGMTQVNTQRFIVANLSGTSFSLYDTFGNPVDTSAFTTYVSGGQMDVISYPPTAPILNPLTGQVITPGQPAGNQFDIGYQGVLVDTDCVGDSGDLMWWEAFFATPTGW